MRREHGTVTAFVAVATVGFMLAVGLVLDGSRVLAARREAHDRAASAARAGAQALDVDGLRTRETRVDVTAGAAAARRHLREHGSRGRVRVAGESVRVEVAVPVRMQLLGLVGMQEVTVTGSGSARMVRGVTRGET